MSYPNTVATLPGTLGIDWFYLRNRYAPKLLHGDRQGWTASLGFSTTYANHANFVVAIAGQQQTVTTSWGSMTRVCRLQHPEYTSLYASRIRCEATGSASGTNIDQMYSNVKIIVDFEQMPFGLSGDTAFMTWDIDQGSIYTTQPGRKFKFSSGEPLDQDAGAWAVQNSYLLTIYNCPLLNDANMDTVSGKINLNPWMGRPAKSLLFGGCKSTTTTTMGGVTTYQKTLQFTYRSYAWDQAYRRDGVLDTPTDPSGNPTYQTADFNLLLN